MWPDHFIEKIDDMQYSDCDPMDIDFEVFFIPLDVEDFLSEAAGLWDAGGTCSSDKNELSWEYNTTEVTYKYDSDGILQELKVENDGDTAYVLTLTNIGPIEEGWISFGFYFLLIILIPIIGIVIIYKRKSKK
ncbi:MAG: hypothetical protein ACTSQJ_07425 [Promethearchaeota archaeon]